jgi:hypothetical protein
LLGDWSFRREERLGRLARSRDPVAIIAARVRSLPSIRQELLRRFAAHNIEREFVNFGKLDLRGRDSSDTRQRDRGFLVRQVIVLKVAMDESGVHDGSPVIAVAAYVARPRQWQDWTKRWNVAKRPIKVMHAVDCQNLTGEFKGWLKEQRDELVKRILPVIADIDIPGVVVGIQMHEFEKALAGRDDLRPIFGTPYAACFQWVVQIIMNFALGALNTERIGFVHELNDYRQEALESFNWIKKHGNPLGNIIGLQFAEKKDYVPLQAADILAYEGNKRLRDPSRQERRAWTALDPDKTRIFAAYYGRDNMADLISRLELIRDGRFDEIDLGSGWKRAAQAAGAGSWEGLRA